MDGAIRVTVWNEFRHEKTHAAVHAVYPDGIHAVVVNFLNTLPGVTARCATLDEPDHGLTEDVLATTDVLTWWGHMAHEEVREEIVQQVYRRVQAGMGLIVMHSGHRSKIFRRLMGTECRLRWRETGEHERVWVVEPGHPIAAGLPIFFDVPHDETYGERFDIPQPDTVVFMSWFSGGEVLRSGCCFQRGCGRIFYFSAGHETFPIYHQPEVQRVIGNAVRWAAPAGGPTPYYGHAPEPLR